MYVQVRNVNQELFNPSHSVYKLKAVVIRFVPFAGLNFEVVWILSFQIEW